MGEDSRQDEHEEHSGSQLHRTTEQGDELTEHHSLAQRENREKEPYSPPRQPAQEPPSD